VTIKDFVGVAEAGLGGDGSEPSSNGQEPQTDSSFLPEVFWSARSEHGHIRQAARSRGAAPDAVFLSVLTHVALRVPPTLTLPAIVGGYGSLNLQAGILGQSGTGKGVAMRIAEDLLPSRPVEVGVGPPGTGQGMLDVYFERVESDDGKRVEHQQVLTGYLFEADEGQVLSKLGEGTGSLTLETMRLSFNGERVGTTTVGAPWRVLHRHGYRMCWLLGFQPAVVRPLLADVAGGTPQRFLWASVVDADARLPRPDHPGELDWSLPGETTGPIRVALSVETEVTQRRHEVLTGKRIPGPFESHRDLLRLKVAALLGILAQRATLTVEDWDLASMVVDASDVVREAVLRVNRDSDARAEAGRNLKAANRAAAEEGARRSVNDNVARVARVIARGVPDAGTITRKDLRRASASRDREWFDAAVDHAEAQGWIVSADDGRFERGDSVPR
jgi:hypothetical protein